MKLSNIRIKRKISDNHLLMVSSLPLLIATILVLRCFNAVFYPILHCEDGTEMVAYYLNNPHPSEIFRFYAGYIILIPNTIGFLATYLFPSYIAPYIMVTFSLALAIASLSIFSLKRYRFIMPDDKSRIFVCLILALIPLGNHALITNLTYSLWNIFIISLFIIIAPLPNSNLAKAIQFGFLTLAVFSNPLSIVFIPICLVLYFVRSSLPDRITNIGIVILTILYAFLGMESTSISYPLDIRTLFITFKYIVHRIVFEPVFGNTLRMLLNNANQTVIINILALCIVCIVTILLSKAKHSSLKNRLPLFGFLLFVIFVVTFISVVGRSMTFKSHIFTPWEQRYFYTQQLLFLFIIVLNIISLINWKQLEPGAKITLLILFFSYVSYLNIYNAPLFRTSKEEGIKTIIFLQLVDKQLRNSRNRDNYPLQMILNRRGKWDIKINLYNNKEQ